MFNRLRNQKNTVFLCGVLFFTSQLSAAITFDFDYRFDNRNFFADQTRRDLLDAAGSIVGNFLGDSLAAIPASTTGAPWQMSFIDPDTGVLNIVMDGETVSENTIKVFAAGTFGLPAGTVAEARIGDVVLQNPGVDPTFDQLVQFRDQQDASKSTPTDYGPWGGSIGFLTNPAQNWGFASPSETPQANAIDFLSTAVHELVHILGFGESDAWKGLISNGQFHGPVSSALNGGPVALDGTEFHWAEGITSRLNGLFQEAALDPTLSIGSRKLLTDLDLAGLQDIGWQVVIPEPSSLSILGVAFLLSVAGRRRYTTQ